MEERDEKLILVKEKLIEYMEYAKNNEKQITVYFLNELLKETDMSFQEKLELRNQLMEEYPPLKKPEAFKKDTQLFNRQKYMKSIDFEQIYSKFFQKIYNNWGFGAMSYFKFLKFIMILNLLTFVISFTFLGIFPIMGNGKVEWLNENCTEYTPSLTTGVYTAFISIFTGEGYLESSFLFYGGYRHTEYTLSSINVGYNTQMGYPLVILVCYGVSLIYLGVMLYSQSKTTAMYKNIRNDDLRFTQLVYIQKIFGSKTSDKKYKLRQFQMEIFHERLEEKNEQTKITGVYIMMRILINIITVGLIGGSALLIYYANEYALKNKGNILIEYSPSFLFIVFDFIFPLILNFFQRFEKYKGNTAIIMKLQRLVLFRMVPLIVYIYFVFGSHDEDEICMKCWENTAGKSLYKILFTIMIFDLLSVLVVTPIHIIITQRHPEFFLMNNIIQLIKMQLLQWIMMIFIPLISMITLIFQILLMILKYIELKYLTSQSKIPLNYVPSEIFFTGVLLGVFNVKCFISLYVFFRMKTSLDCGPFRGPSLFESLVNHIYPRIPGFINKFILQQNTIIAIGLVFVTSAIILSCKLRILSLDLSTLKKNVEIKKKMEQKSNAIRIKYISESKIYKNVIDDYTKNKTKPKE